MQNIRELSGYDLRDILVKQNTIGNIRYTHYDVLTFL